MGVGPLNVLKVAISSLRIDLANLKNVQTLCEHPGWDLGTGILIKFGACKTPSPRASFLCHRGARQLEYARETETF